MLSDYVWDIKTCEMCEQRKNRLDCESSQKGKSLWKRKYISKGCLLLIDITIKKKCDKCVMNFLTIYGKYLKEMWKINFNRLFIERTYKIIMYTEGEW